MATRWIWQRAACWNNLTFSPWRLFRVSGSPWKLPISSPCCRECWRPSVHSSWYLSWWYPCISISVFLSVSHLLPPCSNAPFKYVMSTSHESITLTKYSPRRQGVCMPRIKGDIPYATAAESVFEPCAYQVDDTDRRPGHHHQQLHRTSCDLMIGCPKETSRKRSQWYHRRLHPGPARPTDLDIVH